MGDLTVSVQAQVNVDQVKTTVNMNRQLKNILKSIGKSSILTIHHVKLASAAETNLRAQIENALKGIQIDSIDVFSVNINDSSGDKNSKSGGIRTPYRTLKTSDETKINDKAKRDVRQKVLSGIESNILAEQKKAAGYVAQSTNQNAADELDEIIKKTEDWVAAKEKAVKSGSIIDDTTMRDLEDEGRRISENTSALRGRLDIEKAVREEEAKVEKERQKSTAKRQARSQESNRDGIDKISNKILSSSESSAKSAVTKSSGYRHLLSNEYAQLYDQNIKRLKDYMKTMSDIRSGNIKMTDELFSRMQKEGREIAQSGNDVYEKIKSYDEDTTMASARDIEDQVKRMQNFANKNRRVKRDDSYDEYKKISERLDRSVGKKAGLKEGHTNLSQTNYKDLVSQAKELERHFKNAGLATDTLGGKIKNMYQRFGGWSLVTNSMYKAVEGIRLMVDDVRNIDSAMTELRKVTNETDSTYSKFLDGASDRAKGLGATIADTVDATADFARMDYTLDEATELADAALVYKNVGDGIEDISTASESIISTMKAFGIEASGAMLIVDKFNEVNNLPPLTVTCVEKGGYIGKTPETDNPEERSYNILKLCA